jgi:hypothetical protein
VLRHVQFEYTARTALNNVVVVNLLSFVGSFVTQIPTRTSLVVETIFVEPTGPSVFSKISPAHWQSPRADRVISLVNFGLLGLQRRECALAIAALVFRTRDARSASVGRAAAFVAWSTFGC